MSRTGKKAYQKLRTQNKKNKSQASEYYAVEKIVARLYRRGKVMYRVRWAGYSAAEDSVVAEEDVTPDLIAFFEQGLRRGGITDEDWRRFRWPQQGDAGHPNRHGESAPVHPPFEKVAAAGQGHHRQHGGDDATSTSKATIYHTARAETTATTSASIATSPRPSHTHARPLRASRGPFRVSETFFTECYPYGYYGTGREHPEFIDSPIKKMVVVPFTENSVATPFAHYVMFTTGSRKMMLKEKGITLQRVRSLARTGGVTMALQMG